MKATQKSILRFYNILLAALMTAIGFSSCGKINLDPKAEYGVPSAKFIINGTIEDKETGNVIENIQVGGIQANAVSDQHGYYQITEIGPTGSRTFNVIYQDIDGAVNGDYKTFDTIIAFGNPEFVNGDGHWYIGEATMNIDIKMTPK